MVLIPSVLKNSNLYQNNRLKNVFGSVLFLTIIFFIQFFVRLLAGPLLPAIETDLSLSHAQSGVFMLLMGVGVFFSQLIAPFIASKWGYRRCILISLCGTSLAAVIVGFSKSLWTLNSGFLILGYAAGLYVPSGISLIMVLVCNRDWGKAMGIHELAPNLALILVPIIATVTISLGSWRQGYLYIAIIIAILFIIYLFVGIDALDRPDPPDLYILKDILIKQSFWKMSFLLSIAVGIETGIYSMTPLFFVNERGFSLADANHLLGFSRIPGIIMVMLSGWLTDRFNAPKTVKISFVLTGAAVVLLGICPRKILEILIYFQAAFSACLFPPLLSMLSKISTNANRALMISLNLTIAPVIGGGVFPALIALSGDYGSFSSGFVCAGIISIAGIWIVKF
jgi:NNP family nitrate/nitrite transporter-like MFS transporter